VRVCARHFPLFSATPGDTCVCVSLSRSLSRSLSLSRALSLALSVPSTSLHLPRVRARARTRALSLSLSVSLTPNVCMCTCVCVRRNMSWGVYDGTVGSREIETTGFDPASQFLNNISRPVLVVHRISLLITSKFQSTVSISRDGTVLRPPIKKKFCSFIFWGPNLNPSLKSELKVVFRV